MEKQKQQQKTTTKCTYYQLLENLTEFPRIL